MRKCMVAMLAVITIFILMPVQKVDATIITEPGIKEIVGGVLSEYTESLPSSKPQNAVKDVLEYAVFGNGEDWVLDKNDDLYGTLFRTQIMQDGLSEGITNIITFMEDMDEDYIYAEGEFYWYSYANRYVLHIYNEEVNEYEDRITTVCVNPDEYDPQNVNDDIMPFIVGGIRVKVDVKCISSEDDFTLYNVKIKIDDVFDFDGDYNFHEDHGYDASFEKKLTLAGSLLGKLVFNEFAWSIEENIQFEIPKEVHNITGNYHYTYNPETDLVELDNSGDYSDNGLTVFERYFSDDSNTYYYYKLDNTINLLHDKPWVLEFDYAGTYNLILSPTIKRDNKYPYIINQYGRYMGIGYCEKWKKAEEDILDPDESKYASKLHHYGVDLKDVKSHNTNRIYTFRLENVLNEDGSNMVYLTIYDHELQKCILESTPMNHYYAIFNSEYTHKDEPDNWLNGKDIKINYIGNYNYPVRNKYLDLRIYENGVPEEESVVEDEIKTEELNASYEVAEANVTDSSIKEIVDGVLAEYVESLPNSKPQNAVKDMLEYAVYGNGEDWVLGKNDDLYGTLFRTQVMQDGLSEGITNTITFMEDMDEDNLFAEGEFSWYTYENHYILYLYDKEINEYEERIDTVARSTDGYNPQNANDDLLSLVVGDSRMRLNVSCIDRKEDSSVYSVKIKMYDDFDFDGNYSLSEDQGYDASFEKKLTLAGSLLGKLVINEYTWSLEDTIQIEIPKEVHHITGNYHYTYNSETDLVELDNTGDYSDNGLTVFESPSSNETNTYYYYKLDNTINLAHDKPWVVEYDIKGLGAFVLSPTHDGKNEYPYILNNSGKYVWFRYMARWKKSEDEISEPGEYPYDTTHYQYGVDLNEVNTRYSSRIYTYRLENVINEDGSNMVYLTVYDNQLQEFILVAEPMNQYSTMASSYEYTFSDEPNNWVSGKDIKINYIGNYTYPVRNKYLDLRIYENGVPEEESVVEVESEHLDTGMEITFTESPSATLEPTVEPTLLPTSTPTIEPTVIPIVEPSLDPTEVPTPEPTVNPTSEPSEEPEVILGDLNDDGVVSAEDALILLKYSARLIELTERQMKAAGISNGPDASVVNASNILRYASGVIDSL